jgi:hypothetical protein
MDQHIVFSSWRGTVNVDLANAGTVHIYWFDELHTVSTVPSEVCELMPLPPHQDAGIYLYFVVDRRSTTSLLSCRSICAESLTRRIIQDGNDTTRPCEHVTPRNLLWNLVSRFSGQLVVEAEARA